jgi:hypothetical protein
VLTAAAKQRITIVRVVWTALTQMASSWSHTTAVASVRQLTRVPINWHASTAEFVSNFTVQGETVQAAFYAYKERVFDLFVAKVEKRGDDIYVWEGQPKLGQILAKFPAELLPDMKDKQTMLTYLSCVDATGYMHNLVKKSLEGQFLVGLVFLSALWAHS